MIHKIIDIIHKLWAVQFIRFLIVGGINTIFGYAIYAVLILLNLHYVLAALLSTVCGILFNFKTTGTIVFHNRQNSLIIRFFGIYAIVYLVNIGLLRILDLLGIGSLIAGAIVALPVAAIGFLLQRKFVFKKY